MAFKLHIGDSLSLKSEFSVVEALTILTSASVVASAIYNLGFFTPVNTDFIALLTVQDLLIGAAVASLGLLSAGFAFRSCLNLAQTVHASTMPEELVAGLAAAFSIITTITALLIDAKYVGLFFVLLYGSIVLWATLLDRKFRWKYTRLCLVVFGSALLMYATGMSNYYGSIENPSARLAELKMKSGASISGTIVRATSAYFFILMTNVLVAVPNANVETVTTSRLPEKFWG